MKAKDLINLLFNEEESKEIQESLFYTQFGIISKYFEEYYKMKCKERLIKSLNEKYIQSLNLDLFNDSQRIAIKSMLEVISIEQGIRINKVIK